jgi:NDP-sugar pyrophosphorylase family protein
LKAVVLAAGKGDRLKNIISHIPKPMIEFRGKPILEHNIELCKKYGATELFINTHHLPEVIKN